MRLRVRRRLITPRRLIAVAIVAAIGVVVAVVVGHGNRAAGITPAPSPFVCTVEPHSVEGAATTAIDGLHQLALANIGQADVEQTLARYVTPEKRQPMRRYFAIPTPYVTIEPSLLAWSSVSFDADTAVIRVATSDVATTAKGEQTSSQSVTTVTLKWSPVASRWVMFEWHVGDGPTVAEVVAGGQGRPCA